MERLFTEDLGNSLIARGHWDTRVNGKREEREVFIVDVQFQGVHEGTVILERDLEWPEDGIEWNVCPSEWESLESDVQDWIEREVL